MIILSTIITSLDGGIILTAPGSYSSTYFTRSFLPQEPPQIGFAEYGPPVANPTPVNIISNNAITSSVDHRYTAPQVALVQIPPSQYVLSPFTTTSKPVVVTSQGLPQYYSEQYVLPSNYAPQYGFPGGDPSRWQNARAYDTDRYSFGYVVADPKTGDYKTQDEVGVNGAVRGVYSLLEPNGNIRQVSYSANDASGFNAVVENLGTSYGTPVLQRVIVESNPCSDVLQKLSELGVITTVDDKNDTNTTDSKSSEKVEEKKTSSTSSRTAANTKTASKTMKSEEKVTNTETKETNTEENKTVTISLDEILRCVLRQQQPIIVYKDAVKS